MCFIHEGTILAIFQISINIKHGFLAKTVIASFAICFTIWLYIIKMITFEKSVSIASTKKKLFCVDFRLRYDIGLKITISELQLLL